MIGGGFIDKMSAKEANKWVEAFTYLLLESRVYPAGKEAVSMKIASPLESPRFTGKAVVKFVK